MPGVPRRAVAGPCEQLRVRAARTDWAIGPPVVRPEPLDRDAELGPGLPRRGDRYPHLLITAEHRGVQPAHAQALGEQLPAPAQLLRSVVIAQRPGAQHLEHRQVAVIADLVQVGGAQAALHPDQPAALRVGAALQVPGQRMHPRGGEQHRVTVRRHQRAARHNLVAPVYEEFEEGPNRFGHVHGIGPLPGFRHQKGTAGAAMTTRALANRSRSPARNIVRSGSGNRRADSSHGRAGEADLHLSTVGPAGGPAERINQPAVRSRMSGGNAPASCTAAPSGSGGHRPPRTDRQGPRRSAALVHRCVVRCSAARRVPRR